MKKNIFLLALLCLSITNVKAQTVVRNFCTSDPICEGTTTIDSCLNSLSATIVGTWASSNTAVATVNASTGAVTGVSSGTVAISYTVIFPPVTGSVYIFVQDFNILPIADCSARPTSVSAVTGKTLPMQLHPNPSDGNVTIAFAGGNATVRIMNALGAEVYSGVHSFSTGNAALDLKHLAPGMYTVHINGNRGETQTGKLMIK